MRGREFKDALFAQFAQIAAAFASPKRIEIIDLLAQGERYVEAIAEQTGLTVANTSRHLQVLKGAHLVATRKQGLQVFYRLADAMVLRGYRALQELSEARLAEVSRLVHDYFGAADGLEPVEKDELLRRARGRDVVVLDVRPYEEYAAGHIAGALSIPVTELQRRLAELPAGRRVVAYCRGPYCVLAAEAVRLLRQRGIDAKRLKDGFPEWRDAGLPVIARASPATQAANASVHAFAFPHEPRAEAPGLRLPADQKFHAAGCLGVGAPTPTPVAGASRSRKSSRGATIFGPSRTEGAAATPRRAREQRRCKS